MAQNALTSLVADVNNGTQALSEHEALKANLLSDNSGASRPSYAVAGTKWTKIVSSTVWELYYFDGTNDILMGTVKSDGEHVRAGRCPVGFSAWFRRVCRRLERADRLAPVLRPGDQPHDLFRSLDRYSGFRPRDSWPDTQCSIGANGPGTSALWLID